MRRRLLIFLLALVAGVVVAVALLPFWLGAVARPLAQGRGLSFARYERVSYSRFALHDVEFRRGPVRVTASRVEVDTPVLWGWRFMRRQDRQVALDRWLVDVARSNAPPPPATPTPERGWMPLRATLRRVADQLEKFLPDARLGPGLVRFPGGEIAVNAATWRDRELTLSGLAYRDFKVDGSVAFRRGDELTVNLRTTDQSAATRLLSRGERVEGEANWNGQRGTLTAAFAPRGWLPAEARLNAPQVELPGEQLRLGGVYTRVHGGADIEWRSDRFHAAIHATGEPVPGKAAPPLRIDLRGQGTPQAFTLAALRAELPGIDLQLSEPVVLNRTGRIQGDGAKVALRANLGRQPWFPATGSVTGEARIRSTDTPVPAVEFSLEGRDVTARQIALAGVTARGQLTWPRLEITSATLVAGEGERLDLKGGWDFRRREILDTSVNGRLRRGSVARFLPAQPGFDVLTVSARAQGPLAEFEHSGEATAGAVTFGAVKPLAVDVRWQGRGKGIQSFTTTAKSGASAVTAQGAVTADGLTLTGLDLRQDGAERLKLVAPAKVQWRPTLEVHNVQLAGPGANLTVGAVFGPRGNLQVSGANITSQWLTDWVGAKGPAWELRLFALIGTWNGGPMEFSLTAGAALDLGEGRTAAVNASARGDQSGIRIEALRATEGEATVVNATGRVPVALNLAGGPVLRIMEEGAIALDATAAPNAVFWQKLAALSGVELKEPQAVAQVRGTWRQPEGEVSLKAARVAVDPKRIARPLPAVEQIDVRVRADRSAIILDTFRLNVEGQPVRAQGRIPVANNDWRTLMKEPLSAARRGADFQLEIPEAELAVFTRFLPAVLAPKGRLAANVRFREGALTGMLRLRDAASRPLGPLGVLQEVTADLELQGRKLVLKEVGARSGGQPVGLSGVVELPEKGEPRFDLALKGENLPFVRQTGLLVRGDLDLKLQTPATGPPRLNGTVRLRDSLFLADFRAFLPKGGASASRRPPYFSIDTAPVNTWGLAVEVVGEEFMRLRTPVFAGLASARFRLSGTLGEPRAIGEVQIDEGVVRMPFARFDVQQGSVRLTEADPYEPALYLRGTARRYKYDLTLEVDGKASAPNVVFTSSPALDSEQVLLMVMTGAAPSDEIAVTGTQRVTRLGTYVGQNLLSSLYGADADADRLTITAGEKISRQGKETYDIEYKLTDRWTATGEYNEFDEYNAGLKWRVFRGERRQREEEKQKPADAEKK